MVLLHRVKFSYTIKTTLSPALLPSSIAHRKDKKKKKRQKLDSCCYKDGLVIEPPLRTSSFFRWNYDVISSICFLLVIGNMDGALCIHSFIHSYLPSCAVMIVVRC
jgi:hypothetical protein